MFCEHMANCWMADPFDVEGFAEGIVAVLSDPCGVR
jgi:hypothetical protein